jgi:DNA-binding CsgD family transcriptional regulator
LHRSTPSDLELLLDAAWAAQEGGDYEAPRAIGAIAGELENPGNAAGPAFVVELLMGLGAIVAADREAARMHLARAAAGGSELTEPVHVVWAGSAAIFLGDEEEAGKLWERATGLSRASGALGVLVSALGLLGIQRFIAQRFDQAAAAAAEAEQFAREVGAENLTAYPQFVLAAVAAVRGDDAEAIRRAETSFALAQTHDLPVAAVRSTWALGLVDLGRGRWADALARFESLSAAPLGLAGAIAVRTLPDRIEAAVRAGRTDAARSALDVLEQWAAHAPMPWVPPRVASCRALLAAGDEATVQFEEALRLRSQALPFDLARTQLLYGEHLRRERRRADSRVQFRAAMEAFQRQGAAPWAERAQAELRASGASARRRGDDTRDRLTPQELQISRLVANGLSNKEIAAQLFLSPRTIDSHLRNVFSKLAINSRTQLARMELDDELVGRAAPQARPAGSTTRRTLAGVLPRAAGGAVVPPSVET